MQLELVGQCCSLVVGCVAVVLAIGGALPVASVPVVLAVIVKGMGAAGRRRCP